MSRARSGWCRRPTSSSASCGDVLRDACVSAAAVTPDIETTIGTSGVEIAPLAVQGSPPLSGPLQLRQVQQPADSRRRHPRRRRSVRSKRRGPPAVPGAARARDQAARRRRRRCTRSKSRRAASAGFCRWPQCTAVVLAASAIESDASGVAVVSHAPDGTQSDGSCPQRLYRAHAALRVATGARPRADRRRCSFAASRRPGASMCRSPRRRTRHGSDELLFRMIPDLDVARGAARRTPTPTGSRSRFRGIGEMHGDRRHDRSQRDHQLDRISVRSRRTSSGATRLVHLGSTPRICRPGRRWTRRDREPRADDRRRASQYRISLRQRAGRRSRFRSAARFPNGIAGSGRTYHEAGTLWMGDNPATSVTNDVGRFHHVNNAYAMRSVDCSRPWAR